MGDHVPDCQHKHVTSSVAGKFMSGRGKKYLSVFVLAVSELI